MRSLRVAAAQYPLDRFDDVEGYEVKITDWVSRAAGDGAQLLVFPEYGSIELTALAPDPGDLSGAIADLHRRISEIDALHQMLSRRHGVHILASSAPVQGGDGLFRNVARLFAPCGKVGRQEKIVMTRFERESWGISGGGPINVFRTTLGTIGVSICYDVEFPMIARAQAEAGAEIILAPSATDSLHGYWRVRHGAQARALENQCYVVQAPTVGDSPWTPAMDANRGAAGVFAPPDLPFPEDGVVALGRMDAATWIHADLDLDAVAALRRDGSVLNFAHWREQGIVTAPSAEVVDLT